MKLGRLRLLAVTAFLLLALMIGWPIFWGNKNHNDLHDADLQLKRLADHFQGFRCANAKVIKVVEPSGYDRGGVILSMPEPCRNELRGRANASENYHPFGNEENCFARDMNGGGSELCFEGDRVYFGAARVG